MKIVSGGQTGVDRAALDVAIALGIPHDGWCPQGRRAEDGPIPERYHLRETQSPDYSVRTEQNVLDSDVTLILCYGPPQGGTEWTLQLAERHGRSSLVIDLDDPPPPETVGNWLARHRVEVLNIAGPRESQSPGIAATAREFLTGVLGQ